MVNCTYDTIDKGETTECAIDNNIKSKETAKTLTFEFSGEKVRILENSTLTEEKYEIEFWGEGTNTVDDILVVRFFKLTGEFQGTSMLQLNTSGTCLTLVNSYNDAGGDLNFKRVD